MNRFPSANISVGRAHRSARAENGIQENATLRRARSDAPYQAGRALLAFIFLIAQGTLNRVHAQSSTNPVVLQATVNNGDPQRSTITSLALTFSKNVSGTLSASALQVRHL